MQKYIKKTLLVLIIAIEIFALNFNVAQALFKKLKIPSASSIANDIEERYHINTGSVRNLGEGFNVGAMKGSAPEVDLFFDTTDPQWGEKITATALPMFFSNPKEKLYYTWYLKHEDDNEDHDGDGNIDIEDYKIEAMKLIAQGGYREQETGSESDNNEDGYDATFGGDENIGLSDSQQHCYIHDFGSGENYELVENSSGGTDEDIFSCASGSTPMCIEQVEESCARTGTNVIPASQTCYWNGAAQVCVTNPGHTETYTYFTDYDRYIDSGSDPECLAGNVVSCPTGTTARCVSSSYNLTMSCSDLLGNQSAPSSLSSCTTPAVSSAKPVCEHLFPNINNTNIVGSTGDGDFYDAEENFWRTNINDPNTANNGNKDEANVVGKGIDKFTWNYIPGDKVGVVIEGQSIIPTKYNNSSGMVMWAMVNNDCDVKNKGVFSEEIKGYTVDMTTAEMDLNDCLEDNLVDPLEGGQPGNLEVALTYFPDTPINDSSNNGMGDRVNVQTTVSNTNSDSNQINYKWSMFRLTDRNVFAIDINRWTPIDLTDIDIKKHLSLGITEGLDLSSLVFDLNIEKNSSLPAISSLYSSMFGASDELGYLRVVVDVEENFNSGPVSGVSRTGRSDVIIKVAPSSEKLVIYRADIDNASNTLTVNSANEICDIKNPCLVVKNEIIGARIDDGYTNFAWELNGKPLICNKDISLGLCEDDRQNNYNFFPVTGNPGDTYTLTVVANEIIETDGSGDAVATNVIKKFVIIDPSVEIVRDPDTNASGLAKKKLGDYEEVDGSAVNQTISDYSNNLFETEAGATVNLKVNFFPPFLGKLVATDEVSLIWRKDGEVMRDTASPPAPIDTASISFDIDADAPQYNVTSISTEAMYNKNPEIRNALRRLWSISQFESTEEVMSGSVQVEVVDDSLALFNSPEESSKKVFANLVSNLPGQIMFLFRLILTIAAIIFTAGLVFALDPSPKRD